MCNIANTFLGLSLLTLQFFFVISLSYISINSKLLIYRAELKQKEYFKKYPQIVLLLTAHTTSDSFKLQWNMDGFISVVLITHEACYESSSINRVFFY